jgi:hypothetical protein
MSEHLRILDEDVHLVDDAARLLHVHPITIRRLMSRGTMAPDGRRVLLESLRIGGRRVTSREAIDRFLARVNGVTLDEPEPTPAPQPEAAGLERVSHA